MEKDARKRFKHQKLRTIQLDEHGEVTSAHWTDPGDKRTAQGGDDEAMPEIQRYEARPEQSWTWLNANADRFDFKKMVHQNQKQGGYAEAEFFLTSESSTDGYGSKLKHKCSVRTVATKNVQNAAYSSISEQDATRKAGQMNLFIHDAFPIPPTGEHEVRAGVKFSNSLMPPQFTFMRWLVAHLLDRATDMNTFEFPVYTQTSRKVVDRNELVIGVAWWAEVTMNGTKYSSGGSKRPFKSRKLAENYAALQALITLNVAKRQEFDHGRLELSAGSMIGDEPPLPPANSFTSPAASRFGNPASGTKMLSYVEYLKYLREQMTEFCYRIGCPPPEMFTTPGPHGNFTATATINWITYTGHHTHLEWKAITQAAEKALVDLNLMRKEEARYLDKFPPPPPQKKQRMSAPDIHNRMPLMAGPPRPLMRGGFRPSTSGVHGRGMVHGGHVQRGSPRGMMRGIPRVIAAATPGGPVQRSSPRGMMSGNHRVIAATTPATMGKPKALMEATTRPKTIAPTASSKVTWGTVKLHLAEHLDDLGEEDPHYTVGVGDGGMYTAVISFHYHGAHSYNGRPQHTKKAAEQDAAELALVGIGYLPHRVLGEHPSVHHQQPVAAVNNKRTHPYNQSDINSEPYDYGLTYTSAEEKAYGGAYKKPVSNQYW